MQKGRDCPAENSNHKKHEFCGIVSSLHVLGKIGSNRHPFLDFSVACQPAADTKPAYFCPCICPQLGSGADFTVEFRTINREEIF